MPTYIYECPKCGLVAIERYSSVDDRDEQTCDDCGSFLKRDIISAMTSVTIPAEFWPHFDYGLGKWVETKKDEKNIAKAQGAEHL